MDICSPGATVLAITEKTALQINAMLNIHG